MKNSEVTMYAEFRKQPKEWKDAARIGQLVRQEGTCALCPEPLIWPWTPDCGRALTIDHCHTSGRIRGILCGPCNMRMAAIDSGDEWIDSARIYRDSVGIWLPIIKVKVA